MENLIIKPSSPKELQLLLLLLEHLQIKSQMVRTAATQKNQKGVDTMKYCGTVKFATNPVDLQRKWRDEIPTNLGKPNRNLY